ncbi:vezatin-like [Thrips palmi]|uniref:Vezatin-like n=1 Tax=Thrips palmi TaxID=161013 RepID=A0A6P9A2E8_THRPL|nr:vezatin-like [Thrips palmi]XP_034251458.1 vezatin-like [Thrips palmi]XP_034251459.1 vezatin-like [Thrips palmi]
MDNDEEVILKGSALYDYLHETGFKNFESYELNHNKSRWFLTGPGNYECLQVTRPAPQWSLDHLDSILNCGLLLEDHRHFIECYYPLETKKNSSIVKKIVLGGVQFFCLAGGLWKIASAPTSKPFIFASCATASLFAFVYVKEALRRHSILEGISKLKHTLDGLEKVYVQFRRMLLLVHQNEFITQNISLRQREMAELKKKLSAHLNDSIHKLFGFLSDVNTVPLSVDVDVTLQSLVPEEIYQDDTYSLDSLKRMFNGFILLQSEFLRRLALCYCPDIWSSTTPKAIFAFSKKKLPEILKWSGNIEEALIREQRFFRAVMESKEKQSQLKLPKTNWDFADLYVLIRSASINFQSLLIQIQGLQDILENEACDQGKENEELLNTIALILSEIMKDISSGQSCIDASFVQTHKMMSANQPAVKLCELESVPRLAANPEEQKSAIVNPSVEDEVFELIVPLEGKDESDEDNFEEISAEFRIKRREGETSKRVLQELKTVLVKKAEEWKEREKRAMAAKGMTYTAPDQVKVEPEVQKVTEEVDFPTSDESLDFLPINCDNVWPLPRLKATVRSHRIRERKTSHSEASKHHFETVEPIPLAPVNMGEQEPGAQSEVPRMGFGASLLAEAMAKSRAMRLRNSRKEDIFVVSDEENSSGE